MTARKQKKRAGGTRVPKYPLRVPPSQWPVSPNYAPTPKVSTTSQIVSPTRKQALNPWAFGKHLRPILYDNYNHTEPIRSTSPSVLVPHLTPQLQSKFMIQTQSLFSLFFTRNHQSLAPITNQRQMQCIFLFLPLETHAEIMRHDYYCLESITSCDL
jgi:hypothetical protein